MADAKEHPILVTRSSMPPFEEYCSEIQSIFESCWLTNAGEKHRVLERLLGGYLDVPNVSLFVNGHAALEDVLEALELDGEVITTPFTFVSTANAICRKGLTPVFCDIRQSDYTIDPALIEPLITKRTCAIVPVHVYGGLCDVDAIQEIADKHSLKVIYDAAHAFGVEKDGVGVGNFGDASMFSFHATKVFNTIEGGAVTTADGGLYERLASWKNFGLVGQEEAEYIGGNGKMNEFAAAMGICNLRHVDEEIEKRRRVVERYLERLDGIKGLKLPCEQPGVKRNFAYFPVVFEDRFAVSRDEVFDRLKASGINARKYFYPLVTDLESYRGSFDSAKTPVARQVATKVLTLPLYADLSLAEVDKICDTVLCAGEAK